MAQSCNPDNIIGVSAQGEATIKAADCFDPIELRSSLSSAKGAYANALQIVAPATGSLSCSLKAPPATALHTLGSANLAGAIPMHIQVS